MDINTQINKQMLNMIFANIPANVFFKDTECRYQIVSHVCEQLNGGNENWSIIGKTDFEVQHDLELAKFYYEDDKEIIRTGNGNRYVSKMTFGGIDYFYEIIKEPVKIENGEIIGVIGLVNDVSEVTRLQLQLENNMITDVLTGLNNRHFFKKWVDDHKNQLPCPLSLIQGDCNYLKKVNDTYGHDCGDALLQAVGTLMKQSIPKNCIPIHMSGDEFLVICPYTTEAQVNAIIQDMQDAASKQTLVSIPVSVSYGSATITNPNEDFFDALKQADENMFDNKRKFHEGNENKGTIK